MSAVNTLNHSGLYTVSFKEICITIMLLIIWIAIASLPSLFLIGMLITNKEAIE